MGVVKNGRGHIFKNGDKSNFVAIITPPTLRYKLTANVNGNTYSAEISITRNHDFDKIGKKF